MIRLLIVPAVIFLISCGSKNENSNSKSTDAYQADTVIGSKAITNELAGSVYRKRATAYFVIIDRDTSSFWPTFIETNEGRITIIIRLRPEYTYQQQLNSIALILPHAAKSYNLDSLSSLSLGRLYTSGDLAIELTNQYVQTFGEKPGIPTSEYDDISNFLLNSKLAHDFDKLFERYNSHVSKIGVEKVFFTDRDYLYQVSKIETDTSNTSKKILDCMTWIQFDQIVHD
ncbi:MAG TPA: hypothetical protein PKL31_13540 [Fulvivirga sp.]|nr:hypothetical protein [Fulvivirga sp.]